MNRKLRLLVAISLVLFAALSIVWTLLLPDSAVDPQNSLLVIADAGATAPIAVLALTLSQLAFMIAFVGVAVWLHPATPRLTSIGGALAILGGFGHTVFCGVEMARHALAADPTANLAAAGRLESYLPLMPFMMAGLICTVVGLVLLGIAHLRSGTAPRWAGPVLIAFVLVEFVGGNFTEWAIYLSGLLLLGACTGLAASVLHGAHPLPRRADRTPSDVTVGRGSPQHT